MGMEKKPPTKRMTRRPFETKKEFRRQLQSAKKKKVPASDTPDARWLARRDTPPRVNFNGWMVFPCNGLNPCPSIVLRYARFGLHRYNFLNKGKNLELCSVIKFRKSMWSCASTYDITMVAHDPLQTFEACVSEQKKGRLLLSCITAGPQGEKISEPPADLLPANFHMTQLLPQEMPDWFNPSKPFYVLKKSELQANRWIKLYLELAVHSTNRSGTFGDDLSDLEILKVALETIDQDSEPSPELLRAWDLTLYIWYKDPCEARVGRDVDRIAVVRRVLKHELHDLFLVGWNQWSGGVTPARSGWMQSSETITPKPKRSKTRTLEAETITPKKLRLSGRQRLRLLWLFKPLQYLSRRQAYKNHRGAFLHKTRSI